MNYEHTQKSPLYLIFLVAGVVAVVIISLALPWPEAGIVAGVLASMIVFVALCFGSLTVRDEGECLAVRFGPLPTFRTRIPYANMTDVEATRSDVLDGWGIHWIPGRGLIYNLWGFDCVKLQLGRKTVRVGTDDVGRLASFLKTKIRSPE